MKLRTVFLMLLVVALLLPLAAIQAQEEPVELRLTWYTDGTEDVVMRDLLDRFEAENPDIKVVMDTVAYQSILEQLPLQLAADEGPDMARVTDLGGLAKYYLDMTPYLSDPQYWEDNFDPFLQWLRPPGETTGIYGFMTQLTVTGPFINRTLFDQAGVEPLGEGAAWEEWAEVSRQVAEATGTPYAMAMDRSGHRLAGPAISMGATFFDAEGKPIVTDEGFHAMAELMVQWHEDGTMPLEIWGGTGGSYAAANEEFINGQLVFYISGSWQIGQFDSKIGDAFDWQAVPQPCGPTACTGMPGGAAVVAIKDTEHPEEVARVMEWLAQADILSEFYGRTLFLPAHLGLIESGIEFQTDKELTLAALNQFVANAGTLVPLSYELQGYPYNRLLFDAIRDRLSQVFVGELTLDDAITRIQEDVDAGLAAAEQQ